MDIDRYQELALETCGKIELTNGVLGLVGESGEVADLLKKHLFQGHELNEEKLIEELGDVMWYIAVCSKALNVDMNVVAERNIDKLIARYPNGFSAYKSINRTLEIEV